MSEPVSALPGAAFPGVVRIEEAGPTGMVAIRGDFSDSAVSKAVAAVAGVVLPKPGQGSFKGDAGLLWMSPDELLLLCPHEAGRAKAVEIGEALAGHHHLALDVSDARAVFRISGEGAAIREVLAKLTPADLRTASMPVGRVRRTRLAQVAAAIWFTAEDEARLVCFRSVAKYVFDLLSNAAAPGDEVGYF